MNNIGKTNHMFKILGIIFILLSITVFAKAEIYSFTCDDPFNCSIKSYCQSIPGAVPGLLVHQGTATHNTLGSQPTEYNFYSNQPGANICSIKVQVTAFHSQSQSNEKTALYVNGQHIGTTKDNYCNGPESENCTVCNMNTQYLESKTINLQENNILKIHGYDSHAIVAVTLDCTKQYDPNSCENNLPPTLKKINDKVIRYNSSFVLDFWDYAFDPSPNHNLSKLDFNFSTSNNILDCSILDNRYLNCSSSTMLGDTEIELKVTDPCDASVTKKFKVTVENRIPLLNISNQQNSCSDNLIKIINLKNRSSDEEINLLSFEIVSQSNTDLLNCFIDENYYLSCEINSCDTNYSDIIINVIDVLGASSQASFRISLKDSTPYLSKPFPKICINQDSTNIINFKDYFFDKEDKNNLTFSLNQINKNDIDCSLNNNSLSCNIKTNSKTFNELEIIAKDSANNVLKEKLVIETMCFDTNGIDFFSEQKFFCLEECTSHTQEITLKNNESYACFDFDVLHQNYLNATLTNNKFCLNKNESRKVYLNVNTCNADRTFYDIKLKDYENNVELNFEYQIGNCNTFGDISVRESDGLVCAGTKKDFVVDIKNLSSQKQELFLNAENQLVLPYFSKDKITLEPFESREVLLTINAKTLGKQSIQLSATNKNYHIEKRLVIDVKDCSNLKERNFLIETPSVCFDVTKGQIFESSFNVRRVSNDCINCSFNDKKIELAMFGLQNQLSNNLLSFVGTTSQKVFYSVKVPENISAGPIFLTVTGKEIASEPFEKTGFVQEEQICLNVKGTSNSSINLRTTSRDVFWCDSELFELEIINNGDFDETFDLSTIQKPIGVTINFSQQQVMVPKKSSKTIFISIATSPESIVADNQSVLIKLDGNIPLESRIYFNIKSRAAFEKIEIMSYTQLVEMNANSESNYYLQIRNNTDFDVKNLLVYFENVPQGMEIEQKIIDVIKSKQVITINGKIISKNIDGNYSPVFVIEKKVEGLENELLNKKEFYIIVSSNSNSLLGNFSNSSNISGLTGFTGSFGLNSNMFENGSFIIVNVLAFLTLLLVIVILGVYFSNNNYNNNYDNSWVEVRE
ncbi:MAG: hypothetical protein PHX27_03265 [Candidatus ainarchaeum sp.]|nr:hypothetical protein [Candidatus ainarchaeum sp.]